MFGNGVNTSDVARNGVVRNGRQNKKYKRPISIKNSLVELGDALIVSASVVQYTAAKKGSVLKLSAC